MSARRVDAKPLFDKEGRQVLDEVVGFGPDDSNGRSELDDRLRRLMKQLQEINHRIDRLDEQL